MLAVAWDWFIQHPELIAKVAKVSVECLDVMAKRIADRQSKLTLLLQKTDQMILREIAAAFEALNDAKNATRIRSTRNRLLTLAENNFRNNTNLDKTLKTGDHPNTYWMAQAHYGLAVVCALRSEEKMASDRILRSFIADARQARLELAPELYESMFVSQCRDIFAWHKSKADRIAHNDFASKIRTHQILAGGWAVVGVGAGIGLAAAGTFIPGVGPAAGVQTVVGSLDSADKMWHGATVENYRIDALKALDVERESRIDAKCVELALRALAQIK
jgi:hypothetical protein